MVGGEKATQQQDGKDTEHRDSTDKAPLFTDRREDIVRVDSRARQKTLFNLCIGRLESFAGKASRADGYQRLIDRPGSSFRVNLRIEKGE
jgi:hypothetical protein